MKNREYTPIQLAIQKLEEQKGEYEKTRQNGDITATLCEIVISTIDGHIEFLKGVLSMERNFAERAFAEGGCQAIAGSKPAESFNAYYKVFEENDELQREDSVSS